MPIQAPQWTDYLNCPVCCREFGAPPRSPISLSCGHTLCRHCLKHLHRKQCPFDQNAITLEPEELVVNTALLQLAGYTPPAQPYHPPCIQVLPEQERHAYDMIVRCMEHLAVYLKYCGNANSNMTGNRLSRPMQRKLVTLLQCALLDAEGRGRAARAARSLGERTVTELILQHQNPQQLSANLWAAVRARGCQFLGPAMQEEVLKLVLLALEDGSALSRKVLVMFVVQRLEPHFPQASKTSIGHVVQLLYRASCFKVSKRECDSSLMQLKEEFRTYESLRREHDAQIVQIATEAGLRIAPDQWSALLYGDTAHKSHMQSIIDKLQTPQSFAQSVQELFIALQRTGDPAQLVVMSIHLDRLASIDASPEAKSPSWLQLAEVMTSLKEVVSGLIHYLQQQSAVRDNNHNPKHDRCQDHASSQSSTQPTVTTPTHKFKMSLCRDSNSRAFCPRGNSCAYLHSEEDMDRLLSYDWLDLRIQDFLEATDANDVDQRDLLPVINYPVRSASVARRGLEAARTRPWPEAVIIYRQNFRQRKQKSSVRTGPKKVIVPTNGQYGYIPAVANVGNMSTMSNVPGISGIPNISTGVTAMPGGSGLSVMSGVSGVPGVPNMGVATNSGVSGSAGMPINNVQGGIPPLNQQMPVMPQMFAQYAIPQQQVMPQGLAPNMPIDNFNQQPPQPMQMQEQPHGENLEIQSAYPPPLLHSQLFDTTNQNFNYGPFHRVEFSSPPYSNPPPDTSASNAFVPMTNVPITRNINRFSYDEPIQAEMQETLKNATFTPITAASEQGGWSIGSGPKRLPNPDQRPRKTKVPRTKKGAVKTATITKPEMAGNPKPVYSVEGMIKALPVESNSPNTLDGCLTCERRAVGADRVSSTPKDAATDVEDEQLEKELEALERRIDTEFKSAD